MGTNYYMRVDCCDKCGRGSENIHIGKSSMGWPFAVHIIPEEGINSWGDWLKKLNGQRIYDEYGTEVSLETLDEIVKAKRLCADKDHVIKCYSEYPEFKQPCETGDQLCKGEFS